MGSKEEVIRLRAKIFFALLFVTILYSCNITKKFPQGKYLITKNTIDMKYLDSVPKAFRIKRTLPLDYIPLSQIPTKKFFWTDIPVWLYLKADPEKNNRWNNLLRKIGQAPVYFDIEENESTLRSMAIFMKSVGYLDAVVSDTVVYNEEKKTAVIHYYIEPELPYTLSKISYNVTDTTITDLIISDSVNSLIKPGILYERSVLEKERKRISSYMEEKGYYTFTVNNISYLVDTFHVDRKANVQINVSEDMVNRKLQAHKPFLLKSLIVLPDFRQHLDSLTTFDTVSLNKRLFLYQNGKINVKAKSINRKVIIDVDSLWNPIATAYTLRNLANLKYYRSSNIVYIADTTKRDSLFGHLNGYIRMNPGKLHAYKTEAEISSNSEYTSFILRFGYSNRNIFKGSQQLDVSFNASYDLFYSGNQHDAYEVGAKVGIAFPRLLGPPNKNHAIKNSETRVSLSADIQNRPNYRRNMINATYGYQWTKVNGMRFSYNPVSLSYIALPWIDSVYLSNITNPYLRNTYTNQLIAGTNFGITYNKNTPRGNAYNLRINAETAGNFLYLGYKAFNAKQTEKGDENYYTLLNLRFAQYLRTDIDFSRTYRFGEKSALVWRVFAGAGFGYGNSKSMPFDRLFYAGGSSSMRGWQIRTLGPGNKPGIPTPPGGKKPYPSALGDIRLEANLEGRFQILGPFRGAVFFDVGNIWSNGKGETDDRAIFHFNSFYKQLGFNTGVGLRLDLNFFVLRLDWGIKLHDPSRDPNQRWIGRIPWKDLNAIHFAIGYPF